MELGVGSFARSDLRFDGRTELIAITTSQLLFSAMGSMIRLGHAR